MKNYPEGFYITAKIECPWMPGVNMEVRICGTRFSEAHQRNITNVEHLDKQPVFVAGTLGGWYMSHQTDVFTSKIKEVIVWDVDGNEIDNLGKPPGPTTLTPMEQHIVDNGQETFLYDERVDGIISNPYLLTHEEADRAHEYLTAKGW